MKANFNMERQPSSSKSRIDKFGFEYYKRKQLGKGAYSVAFLYQRSGELSANPFNNFFYDSNLSNSKYCVLKYYFENLDRNQGLSFSSLRQINLMLTSDHPHIVTAHQVFYKREKVQLIMDFYLDLAVVIYNEKFINNLKEKKKICYHITRGLAHLHENYILHRDLKPQNIFVSRDGLCKIGDFGMSKQFGTPGRKYTPGVCTRQYRAPELFLDTNYYTQKIDIWSLGCIFYFVLTGNHLFAPSTNQLGAIINIFSITGTPDEHNWKGYSQLPKIFEFQPYPKKNLVKEKGLSQEANKLIQACIDIDPKKRPSASDLLQHPFFSQLNGMGDIDSLDVQKIYVQKLQKLLKGT